MQFMNTISRAILRFRATFAASLLLSLMATGSVSAIDHKVQSLDEAPPADEISSEIASQLAPTGIRVIRGNSTTLCDIWLKKELPAVANFKPTTEVLYPFQPGQLIGVARFARKSSDFRDQDIAAGVYTMRYAQQPVDGAHVGTSPTRDFLLLIEASKDKSPEVLEYKPLTKQSAEAAGSSHPALLPLQKISSPPEKFPSIRHDEERDWWIVAFQANVANGDQGAKPLPVELVVVGVAAE